MHVWRGDWSYLTAISCAFSNCLLVCCSGSPSASVGLTLGRPLLLALRRLICSTWLAVWCVCVYIYLSLSVTALTRDALYKKLWFETVMLCDAYQISQVDAVLEK